MIDKSTTVTLKSTTNNYKTVQEFLVLHTITGKLPQVKINRMSLKIPNGITLADPGFQTPGNIDL